MADGVFFLVEGELRMSDDFCCFLVVTAVTAVTAFTVAPKALLSRPSAEVPSKAEIHNRLVDSGKSALFICLRTLLATRFNGGNQDFCRNADLGRKTLHTDSWVSM